MATDEEAGPRVLNGSPNPNPDERELRARGPNDEPALKRKASLVEGDGEPALKRKASLVEGDGEPALKRKASLVEGDDDGDDDDNDAGTKRQRQRQDAYAREQSTPPPTSEPRRGEEKSPPRRRPSGNDTLRDRDRRDPSAVQLEEKKRGKRLFGGLLSTLSQTSTSSGHKRRQEIERRQMERLQKQRDLDDRERAERMSKIREARLVEQVDFQEEIMRHRHTKMLALAEFFKTKAEPAIYYLPWKRTAEQEDVIDEQIRVAKSTIAREEEESKGLRERHAARYGSRRDDSHARGGDDGGEQAAQQEELGKDEVLRREEDADVQRKAAAAAAAHHQDAHDESGDVLVDADEDMVIY